MHRIQALALICCAAASGAAPAETPDQDPAGVLPAWTTAGIGGSGAAGRWGGAARSDRLGYLGDPRCHETTGCSSAYRPASRRVVEYEYIDALDLGSYGPMDLKFTGKRVKFKVRF